MEDYESAFLDPATMEDPLKGGVMYTILQNNPYVITVSKEIAAQVHNRASK